MDFNLTAVLFVELVVGVTSLLYNRKRERTFSRQVARAPKALALCTNVEAKIFEQMVYGDNTKVFLPPKIYYVDRDPVKTADFRFDVSSSRFLLGFERRSFDQVFLFNCPCHCKEIHENVWPQILADMGSITRNGGLVYIKCWPLSDGAVQTIPKNEVIKFGLFHLKRDSSEDFYYKWTLQPISENNRPHMFAYRVVYQ
jgi:SAM-dependent methyltransferase